MMTTQEIKNRIGPGNSIEFFRYKQDTEPEFILVMSVTDSGRINYTSTWGGAKRANDSADYGVWNNGFILKENNYMSNSKLEKVLNDPRTKIHYKGGFGCPYDILLVKNGKPFYTRPGENLA